MENVKNGVYVANGNEVAFSFRTELNAYNKVVFVNRVTEYILGDNYNSVLRDLMFNFVLVDVFTDVDIEYIKESSNIINEIESFINGTNIVDVVKANMVDGLLAELNQAVDDNIEYRTGIHRNALSDSLSSLLRTVERMLKNIDMNDMMDMAKKIGSVSGDLSAEKILEAYRNSDMFNKTIDEISEKRKEQDDKQNKIIELVANSDGGKNADI